MNTRLEQLKKPIRMLVQVAAYVVITPGVRLFFKTERFLPKEWRGIKPGTLFVSNHQSMADPFVVLANIPFRCFLNIIPIHFPVDNEEYHRPYLRPFLRLLGGYDIGGTKKEKLIGLLRTRSLLKAKRTVFLFPEGKINKEAMGVFQPGIELLAKESNGVVFVRLQGFGRFRDLLTRNRSFLKFSPVHDLGASPLKTDELRALIEQL